MEVGCFEALTTIEKAITRLKDLKISKSSKRKEKVEEMITWLSEQAKPDDLIALSSEFIYSSPDGEFNNEYVKQDINRKVKEIKNEFDVPYWKKGN